MGAGASSLLLGVTCHRRASRGSCAPAARGNAARLGGWLLALACRFVWLGILAFGCGYELALSGLSKHTRALMQTRHEYE